MKYLFLTPLLFTFITQGLSQFKPHEIDIYQGEMEVFYQLKHIELPASVEEFRTEYFSAQTAETNKDSLINSNLDSVVILRLDSGRIISKVVEEGRNMRASNYYYDKGRLTSNSRYNNGKFIDSFNIHYKRNGSIQDFTVYDQKGRQQYKYSFSYNQRNLLTNIKKRNKDNFSIAMFKYAYHSPGEISKVEVYDENFRLTEVIRISPVINQEISAQGYSVAHHTPNNQYVKGFLCLKNEKGQVLEEAAYNENKGIIFHHNFTYDEQGVCRNEKRFTNDEPVMIHYKYTPDSNDWKRKEVFSNDTLINIEIRHF